MYLLDGDTRFLRVWWQSGCGGAALHTILLFVAKALRRRRRKGKGETRAAPTRLTSSVLMFILIACYLSPLRAFASLRGKGFGLRRRRISAANVPQSFLIISFHPSTVN